MTGFEAVAFFGSQATPNPQGFTIGEGVFQAFHLHGALLADGLRSPALRDHLITLRMPQIRIH
ncbi:hypothetical protein A5671_07670 [Mycolicibacter heraklionensis]|nr:hypothetical protein A5671_07670 [Mycolicibacter heraklionensis]